MKKITTTENQTLQLGKTLGKSLAGGEVIALFGNLGAGKTVFTKGLAQGLGIKRMVPSPTFTLMNVYPTPHKTVTKLVHIDCYRTNDPQEIAAIGATEYFGQKNCVVVVEWADKIKKLLPKNCISVTFAIKKDTAREIVVDKKSP